VSREARSPETPAWDEDQACRSTPTAPPEPPSTPTASASPDLFGRDGTIIVHARPNNHANPDRPPYLAGRDDPCNSDRGTASPAAPSSPLSRNLIALTRRRTDQQFPCSAPYRRGCPFGGPIRPPERRSDRAGIPGGGVTAELPSTCADGFSRCSRGWPISRLPVAPISQRPVGSAFTQELDAATPPLPSREGSTGGSALDDACLSSLAVAPAAPSTGSYAPRRDSDNRR